MAGRLYLNNILVDLESKPVTRKIQVSDVGDITAIKSSFSYTVNIPKTSRNIETLEMLGVIGNQSRKPYEAISVDYVEDNIYLVSNGIAIIRSKNKKIQLNIIDGFKSFENILGSLKLNDLDFSTYDHNITLATYQSSLSNTSGYIYAIADFGQGLGTSVKSYFGIDNDLITGDHSLPVTLGRQPDGAGGRTVITTIGVSSLNNSFFVVQENSEELNIYIDDLTIEGEFTSDTSSVDLLLKQFRNGVEYDSVTLQNEIGDDTDTFEIIKEVDETFTDIAEGDYFILSMELNSGSFESEVVSYADFKVEVTGILKIEKQAPSFFLHTLFDMILDQNDIDNETDLLLDAEFKKELITISEGYIVSAIGQAVSLDGKFDDVKQIDIIKDIAFRYGLVMINKADTLHLVEINKIVTGEFGTVDWSSKLAKLPSENYTPSSYSKNNNFKYKYPEGSPKGQNGVLEIDNENIPEEVDMYESIFEIANTSESLGGNATYLVPIHEVTDDGVENKTTPIKLFKLALYNVAVTVKLLDDASTASLTTNVPFLSLTNVDLQYYIDNYYDDFNVVIDDYDELDASINLNSIDIHNLDFTKLIFLKQTGRRYWLNPIQYTKGKVSKVKLIRV